jgi:hypothetical protein
MLLKTGLIPLAPFQATDFEEHKRCCKKLKKLTGLVEALAGKLRKHSVWGGRPENIFETKVFFEFDFIAFTSFSILAQPICGTHPGANVMMKQIFA